MDDKMARIRTVKPILFRHLDLYRAERDSGLPLRLSFIGLFTVADREGRFRWVPEEIKLDCLPYDQIDFGKVLDVLAEYGFIKKYSVGGKDYGYIPSWQNHQVINKKEAQSAIPVPSGDDTGIPVNTGGEKEGKGKEGKDSFVGSGEPTTAKPSKRGKKTYTPEFEQKFWKGYPTDANMSKAEAFDEWLKLSDEERTQAVASVPAFQDYCRTHPDYRPVHACRYLKYKRFEGHAATTITHAQAVAELESKFLAFEDTPQFKAWDDYLRKTRGSGASTVDLIDPKTNRRRPGRHFDSEWPPGHEQQAA